ncbi:MAG: hypothetical protein MJ189_00400 [Coriobacteriales bacterium]|nr:hypothetical protein [Coriobacteriales bacterium]
MSKKKKRKKKSKKKSGCGPIILILLLVIAVFLAIWFVPWGNIGDIFKGMAPAQKDTVEKNNPRESILHGGNVSNIIPNAAYKMYLQQLNGDDFSNVEAIYENVSSFNKSFQLPFQVDEEKISCYMSLLHYDCPELFQIDGSYQSLTKGFGSTTSSIEISPNYIMDKSEYDKCYETCKKEIESICNKLKNENDLVKEQSCYEYIIEHSTYKIDTKYSGTAYGVFGEHQAKCDGFSFAMKWAMDYLEIPCVLVAGDPKSGGIGHAWNSIEIDGAFYDVDVTAEVSGFTDEDKPIMYSAFNVSKSWIRSLYNIRNELTTITQVPGKDSMDHSYHYLNNTYVEKGKLDWDVINKSYIEEIDAGRKFSIQFEDASDMETFKQSYFSEMPGVTSGCTYLTDYKTVCLL